MNKERRKLLEQALSALQAIGESGIIPEVQGLLDEAAEGEREYYDNMPEGLQGSDRGEKAGANVTALEEAVDNMGELEELFEATIGLIEEALS